MTDDDPQLTRLERSSTTGGRSRATGLPEDLLRDSARRVRVIALVYGVGMAIAVGFNAALDPLVRERYTQSHSWLAILASIGIAVLMAVLAGNRRIPAPTLMNVGLVFEVVAAYGIATASYWGSYRDVAYGPEHLTVFGLSYVAPWVMFFTIVAPNPPRRALAAAAAAGSAVPVVMVLTTRFGGTSIALTTSFVVNALIVPWVMIVVTAYIGALVVYRLGTAVTKARELGSYRLTERLGGGGMGEVWRAKHRMLARPAAIKLIRPDDLGGGGRESQLALQQRFEREAQATALLRSPHTIEVYDFGVTEDGTFYYVMELLAGFDLETLVERFGPVPPERAAHLLRQVCDSLMEAHEGGLIHRDIKPANIYLCRRGRPVDFAKVLDFGLVKPRWDTAAEGVRLTAEHEASGTPAYMAPEQITGDGVDGRTDIYALGCVAYWLVTGQLVFGGASALEVVAHHMRTPPVPPSRRSEVPIPPSFEQVVLACLEKDPARRPQTAEQLDAWLATCEMETPWTPERARDWWAAHEPTVAAGRLTGGRIQVV